MHAAKDGIFRLEHALGTGDATVATQGGTMDRHTWLDQRRAAVLASYDQEAPTYDDHGYPTWQSPESVDTSR